MLKRLLPIIAVMLLGAHYAGAQSADLEPVSAVEVQATPVSAAPSPPGQVFKFAEQMPAFKGDINSYFSSHLKYPAAAKKAGIEGRVFVSFIVTEKGLVKEAQVGKSSGDANLDAEAVRVVNAMNNPDGTNLWTPGKQNGRAVSCYFTLPVIFKKDCACPRHL